MAELQARPAISVIMITGNVIEHSPGRAVFERALQSVAWAGELIIVDSDSRDGTRELAARYTDKIWVHPYQNSLKLQKKIAVTHVTGDWILWVDADEILPPALIAEIQRAAAAPAGPDAYRIHRQHFFVGKLLAHAGEDAPLRLWRRGAGHWDGPENDEFYVVDHPGVLTTPLEHYSTARLADRLHKIAYFSPAHAAKAELPPHPDYSGRDVWRWIVKPTLQRLYGVYWLERGYKDGVRGLIWSVLCAINVFYVHVLVWERAQTEARNPKAAEEADPEAMNAQARS